MSLITREDLRDVYIKAFQRGLPFLTSKLTFNKRERTKSAFNSTTLATANWWIVPYVKERWNRLITGDSQTTYEEYLSAKFFSDEEPLKMVSIGSGICSHEMKLAELNPSWQILCIDIADDLFRKAENIAKTKNLKNIEFLATDVYHHKFPATYYDIVFFHSALHHFNHIESFVKNYILPTLSSKGKLIINEYVGANRMQYSALQIKSINESLKLIDKQFRQIFKTPIYKDRYFGSGELRMKIADPSECVDSESILPVLHKHLKVVEEKPYGGNLLMSVLKDISHHFVELDERRKTILDSLFACEDKYLLENSSDFLFGVYSIDKENS